MMHGAYCRWEPNHAAWQKTRPWADAGLQLAFGGVSFCFRFVSDGQARALEQLIPQSVEDNLIDNTQDVIEIEVYRASDAFIDVPTRGLDYRVAISFEPAQVHLSGIGFYARIDRASKHTALYTNTDGAAFLNAAENTLRVISAYRLLERDALCFHSAGISDGQKTVVALGQSGAGKTTLCRLAAARQMTIHSDELNAIFLHDGKPFVLSLPFAGDFGRTSSMTQKPTALTAIWQLRQSQRNKLRPLSPARALAAAYASCVYVNSDPFVADALDIARDRILGSATVLSADFDLSGDILPQM